MGDAPLPRPDPRRRQPAAEAARARHRTRFLSGVLGPLARTIVFVFVLPFSVVVLVPSVILTGSALPPEGWAWLGLLPIAAGVAVLFVCFAGFVLEGRGTPGPWDPPRRLVTGVLYARVRNPMYVGILIALVGEAILFRALSLLAWVAFVFAAFHTFVVLYEEPTLSRIFGAAYDDYRRRVPRWIPRSTSLERFSSPKARD